MSGGVVAGPCVTAPCGDLDRRRNQERTWRQGRGRRGSRVQKRDELAPCVSSSTSRMPGVLLLLPVGRRRDPRKIDAS